MDRPKITIKHTQGKLYPEIVIKHGTNEIELPVKAYKIGWDVENVAIIDVKMYLVNSEAEIIKELSAETKDSFILVAESKSK